jgi:hypothetical protein
LVLQSATELAEALASDAELLPEVALVITKVFDALESPDEVVACSPGCRDYAQVLKQPFLSLIRRLRGEAGGAGHPGNVAEPKLSSTERRELLDELF